MDDLTLRQLADLLSDPKADLRKHMEFMQSHGSSITLNYGEDTGEWECSWISGGKRFSGNHRICSCAILECLDRCFKLAVRPL